MNLLEKLLGKIGIRLDYCHFFPPVGGGSVVAPYTIANAVRLRSGNNAYLESTTVAPTSSTKKTFLFYFKQGSTIANGTFYSCSSGSGTSANYFIIRWGGDGTLEVSQLTSAAYDFRVITTRALRDPTAHQLIRVSIDTTQAAAANRIQIQINLDPVETTFSPASYPAQNSSPYCCTSGKLQRIGYGTNGSNALDGLISEYRIVDGGALSSDVLKSDPNNSKNVVPKAYTGSYGASGSFLKFNDGSTLTNLGLDRSGNGLNWTLNNISITTGTTYDWLTDTPTNNYATLNPLQLSSVSPTLSNGNLTGYFGSNNGYPNCSATFSPEGLKGYFEFVCSGTADWKVGFQDVSIQPSNSSYSSSQTWVVNNSGNIQNGTTNVVSGYLSSIPTGTVVGCAFDFTGGNRNVWFSSGGTWGTNGSVGNPATGSNPAVTSSNLTSSAYRFFFAFGFGPTLDVNFGQRSFTYTPPTGFKALCTSNLPAVTIKDPSQHHYVATVAKSGNTSFTLPWDATTYDTLFEIKIRGTTGSWYQVDGLRGYDKILHSDTTAAETTDANVIGISGTTITLKSSLPDGSYVVKCYKAGLAASRQTNTSGSITSTVSANTTSGFSIVTFTGTGANATVGHGVGSALKMLTVKARVGAGYSWQVWHAGLTSAAYILYLEQSAGQSSDSTKWNSTAPSSSVFSLGTAAGTNNSGTNFVAYCHAEVAGYSKFGSYNGNGLGDGVVLQQGFKTGSITVKQTTASTSTNWVTSDTARDQYNLVTNALLPNANNAEDTTAAWMDILAGCIKFRSNASAYNGSSATYAYMSHAEAPFGGSNIYPACAR